MNKYQFYSKILQEDFPVKYRQEFAEHDSEQQFRIILEGVMTIACKKHQKEPVVGYSPCPGCEVERLRNEIDTLKQQFNVAVGLLADTVATYELEREAAGLHDRIEDFLEQV